MTTIYADAHMHIHTYEHTYLYKHMYTYSHIHMYILFLSERSHPFAKATWNNSKKCAFGSR